MKRFLPLLAVCALFLPVVQPARGADPSISLFYDNLNGGNWYEVADYGYVWQPDVATDQSWRPYTDGYWAYTDQGWTWVSYEDFGWATYHYGRWARLTDYGWVWVPGTEWAPAWVSWRTGGDYVGWAPLPPTGGGEVVYEGRPITGHVDVEFGIGPAYYNFIDMRYIGEPVLRDRIFPYERNVTVINNTVNVTNITYNNSTVYNYGPDYATVSRYSVRPIQRLKLERQNVDPLQAVRSGNVTKVQGNTLLVAAPQKLQKASGTQAAPKQVKAKIEQPKVEKGWANTGAAEKAKLEQKFKAENAKNVPKPDIQPSNQNAAAGARANETAGAGAAVPPARGGKGKQKGEKAERANAAEPAVSASPTTVEQGKRGKNKNRAEREQTTSAAGANAVENQPPNAGAAQENLRHNKASKQNANASENESPNAGAAQENPRHNKASKQNENVAPAGAGNEARNVHRNERNELKPENANTPQGEGRHNERLQGNEERRGQGPQRELGEKRGEQMANPPGANPVVPANAARPRHDAVQAPGQGQQRGEGANEPRAKAKAKKNEGEPTPSPQ